VYFKAFAKGRPRKKEIIFEVDEFRQSWGMLQLTDGWQGLTMGPVQIVGIDYFFDYE
jgi:hypothetical protein